MTRARRDENRIPTLIGVSSVDGETSTLLEVDPSSGELLVKAGSLATYLSPLATFVTTAVTLTTANTAYKLPASEQASRKTLVIYNVSDTAVYIGTSSVTTTNGILLPAGGTMTLDAESNVYAVCGTSGKIVNVLEGK